MKLAQLLSESSDIKIGDKFKVISDFTAECISYDGQSPPTGLTRWGAILTIEDAWDTHVEFVRSNSSAIFKVKRKIFESHTRIN